MNITADKAFGIYCARDVKIENCKITTPEGENKLSTADAPVSISN